MICLSRRRQGNKFYVLQRPCQTFELIQLSPRSAAPPAAGQRVLVLHAADGRVRAERDRARGAVGAAPLAALRMQSALRRRPAAPGAQAPGALSAR